MRASLTCCRGTGANYFIGFALLDNVGQTVAAVPFTASQTSDSRNGLRLIASVVDLVGTNPTAPTPMALLTDIVFLSFPLVRISSNMSIVSEDPMTDGLSPATAAAHSDLHIAMHATPGTVCWTTLLHGQSIVSLPAQGTLTTFQWTPALSSEDVYGVWATSWRSFGDTWILVGSYELPRNWTVGAAQNITLPLNATWIIEPGDVVGTACVTDALNCIGTVASSSPDDSVLVAAAIGDLPAFLGSSSSGSDTIPYELVQLQLPISFSISTLATSAVSFYNHRGTWSLANASLPLGFADFVNDTSLWSGSYVVSGSTFRVCFDDGVITELLFFVQDQPVIPLTLVLEVIPQSEAAWTPASCNASSPPASTLTSYWAWCILPPCRSVRSSPSG
jgi:hypothetical protein